MYRSSVSSDSGCIVPTAFAALVVLAINDQVLKAEYHNAFTGKLSDAAGLILVPLVGFIGLEMLLSLINRPNPTTSAILGLCVATGIGFGSIQMFVPASEAFETILTTLGPGNARNTMDPTDLLVLPVLWLPWRIMSASMNTMVKISSPE